MNKQLKIDILNNLEELKPFLKNVYKCSLEQQLGCVAKAKTPTPSPGKPKQKTRKRCPKGTRKNPKTKECDPIKIKTKSLAKSPQSRKRCPKGTRKNPKTGNCDPITQKEKTVSLKKSIPKPDDIEKQIIQLRDLLYNTIGYASSKVKTTGNKYLDTVAGIATKDKFETTRLKLYDLVSITKQEKEYKDLLQHTLEYHIKKNNEETKETPEIIYNKLESFVKEVVDDPIKAKDKANINKYNQLRKKLKAVPLEQQQFKHQKYILHTLNFFLKQKKKASNNPKEPSAECNMLTICQHGGSCWFVTVFMMLAKIKPLYELLKPKHKTFVDGLLVCQKKDMGNYCKLPPSDIWNSYREKDKKYKSTLKAYPSKDSIKIEEALNSGGYSFILFKVIMKLNNIYYLFDYMNYRIKDPGNLVDSLNERLSKISGACNWLMRNYDKGEGESDYLNVLLNNGGLKYRYVLEELISKKESWPTEEGLKKGICFRSLCSFTHNNEAEPESNKMRVPELSNVLNRKNWNITKNWLSQLAKTNLNFVGGWFYLVYPKKLKIGGVLHKQHATGFSVCRDDPANPTINICNTWGGNCSIGKHNPWGPSWDSKKIILGELQIIQYFPPLA